MDEAVANYYANKICNLMHQYPDNQVGRFLEWMPYLNAGLLYQGRLVTKNKTTMLPQLLLLLLYKTPSSKIPKNKTPQSMLNGLKTLSNRWTGKQMAHRSKH
jgi:hypothetical protein